MEKEILNSTVNKNPRTVAFFQKEREKVYRKADRLFAVLMPLQWFAAIVTTFITPPSESGTIPHLWLAVVGGGFITLIPTFLALKFAGKKITRNVIAVCQILISVLLIHLTGGWIEAYFHIFGSLALLAFYRNWKVLIPAALVAIVDHFWCGFVYPQSFYGISEQWRWAEYTVWIVLETIFLSISCRLITREMWEMAAHTTALDDSESRYRAVVEQITEGILLVSRDDYSVIDCNEAFANLIGYENLEEVKTLKVFAFDLAKREEIVKMAEIAFKNNSSIHSERKYRRKDDSIIHVEIIGRPINYREHTVFCVNARDITERKRVESEMKRLAVVAEQTQNSVIITNTKGEVEWVNKGFTRLTGYTLNEVIGTKPGKILQGKETNPETPKEMRKAFDKKEPFSGQIYNYGKDGRGYWISTSIMPIHDEEGVHVGFMAVQMDITAQKEMENALRQARDEMEESVTARTAELLEANLQMSREVEERKRAQFELSDAQQFLRKVIDNVPNMIFVKDKHGRYTLANRALANLYGISVNNLIGKTDDELILNPEEAANFKNDDQQIIETWEEKFIFEEKFTDKKGNVHWLQTVKRPMIGDTGVENILGIATDMTERKILESQLRHAQKLESIGQLAAGIAHEINTPTQYVGDNTRFIRDAFIDINRVLEKYDELFQKAQTNTIDSEMLKEIKKEIEDADLEYLIEEVPNAVQQSLEGVSRIAKIVQSMKDFAHPGSKEKTAVDLNKAIESTITVARNEWKYVAELETHFDQNLPPVPCLLGEFNQVVLNMVINASHAIADVVGDASHGKGKITVSTTKVSDEWAEVRIADTGTGIPPEVQSRVFDPFFTTKEVGKGTGQGLAISHTVVVDKHNGKLSFETEPGKGTTFIIRLPLNQGS